MTGAAPVTGTQSAGKALALLHQVANHHPQGVRLTDLIDLAGLDRSTTHRLLACLLDEGFVERTQPGKLYRLGIEAMQLGQGSAGLSPLVERFRPVMQALAQQTGDAIYLIVRSGDHALCLHREQGPSPLKALEIEPGMRRLMGLSAVGVGILARLPDAELEACYERQRAHYRPAGMTLDNLQRLVRDTRRAGYSRMSDQRAEDTRGVGCAVRLSSNTYAGLSIAAINASMTAARQRKLGAKLLEELRPLEWDGGKPDTRRA